MAATLATPSPVRIAMAPAPAPAAEEPAATVTVCTGKACCRKGAENLLENLKATAPDNVFVCSRGCMGKCRDAPVMAVTTTEDEIAQKTVMKVSPFASISPRAHQRCLYVPPIAIRGCHCVATWRKGSLWRAHA